MNLKANDRLPGQTKVFVDDEGYNTSSCGEAYASYGINPTRGAVIIIRPDQCKYYTIFPGMLGYTHTDNAIDVSKVCELGDSDAIRTFFEGCLLRV